jgi:hypothetical protein
MVKSFNPQRAEFQLFSDKPEPMMTMHSYIIMPMAAMVQALACCSCNLVRGFILTPVLKIVAPTACFYELAGWLYAGSSILLLRMLTAHIYEDKKSCLSLNLLPAVW